MSDPSSRSSLCRNSYRLDNILYDLSQGTELQKIKGGGILYNRTFYVDTESMKLLYKGSQKRFRKKHTVWSLSSIEEVREGERDYAKRLNLHNKERIFCVVFVSNKDVLYLLARDKETRNNWVTGLRHAMHVNQLVKQMETNKLWIQEAFDRADKNNDQALDFDEVVHLLKVLNADMQRSYVKKMFYEADTNHSKAKRQKPTLDRNEFVQFYTKLTDRPEIEDLYKGCTNDGYMTAQELQIFLTHEQKDQDVSIERCQKLIKDFEMQPDLIAAGKMSVIGFRSFLVSSEQHLFSQKHRGVYQKMTHPMTDYFINSSHNTYLAEDQLMGPSKVECYISALKRGCRCVERAMLTGVVDCWDGSDGEPIIYHGYTLTSKILFYDVIKAISDYAFVKSPYPVTLSLENHCSIEQQTWMAECMKSLFGNKLYYPTNDSDSTPSPEQLKHKIIIKGKKIHNIPVHQDSISHSDSSPETSDDDENANNKLMKQQMIKKKTKSMLSQQLSDMVAMKSEHFAGVQKVPDKTVFSVVSVGENKMLQLLDSKLNDVCQYTNKMLFRIYPKGSRTNSSNYNPVQMWCGGCQMVALNFQTGGDEMQLLHGRFLDNGDSGYVLKPECLRSAQQFQAVLPVGKKPPTQKILTLKIISGFQLPKPKDSKKGEIIDPFLKVEIHGTQNDNQQQKTVVVENNGFKPIWNETLKFVVNVPELALVRFGVYDKDTYNSDDFIGYYVVPFNSLMEGYRHFPLFDKNGDQFEQSLIFVYVRIS